MSFSDMSQKRYFNVFKPEASISEQALILIFDLEGFSNFFSSPDVNQYVPNYLNQIFGNMKIIISGGIPYWEENTLYNPLPDPTHWKFLGDGALYIWQMDKMKEEELVFLLNRLWNIKHHFKKIIDKISADVPVENIPKRIRFGLAAGSVYRLLYHKSRDEEYIGYSINLAARLQSYCKDLGFIASARVRIPDATIREHNYMKVIAKNIKGFPREIVIVDKEEYNVLDSKKKEYLFDPYE